jgi:putative molybdopterin biosynthesis protein
MPRARKSVHPADVQAPAIASGDMMDTREVAAYLRLKERRIYDLVRTNVLPHVRATGKLLFPRAQIDAWLAAKAGSPRVLASGASSMPPIIAGSHDPLLEWAARESRCGLAILPCGSRAGIARLADGGAMVAATHWLDAASGEYNVPLVRTALAGADIVAIEWAQRAQGLVVRPGNPLQIRGIGDLAARNARVIARQPDSGSDRLLDELLRKAGIGKETIRWLPRPALTEMDLAEAIHDGGADAGLAIEAAARSRGLTFIPLVVERFDLIMHRRDYFEPALQALWTFARTPQFAAQARTLSGYDVGAAGRVVFNG